MKLITQLFVGCSLLFSLAFFTNCSGTEPFDIDTSIETPNNLNALGFISYLDGLDTLERVLNVTDWRANLVDTGFTFFAPTNEAFSRLVADNDDWNSVLEIPQEEMIAILDYHFMPTLRLNLQDSIAQYFPTTLNTKFDTPASIFIKTDGSIRINGERTLALQDVKLTNGNLQLVNEFSAPVTVATLIKANPELSILADLLERKNFSQDLEEVLESEGPFTIFAPTDSAFLLLTQALGIGSVELIPAEVLEQTLLYHISNTGNIPARDLMPGVTINTLNNSDFEIKESSNFRSIQGVKNTVEIISTDGQGNNGVIHLIDGVLQVE